MLKQVDMQKLTNRLVCFWGEQTAIAAESRPLKNNAWPGSPVKRRPAKEASQPGFIGKQMKQIRGLA